MWNKPHQYFTKIIQKFDVNLLTTGYITDMSDATHEAKSFNLRIKKLLLIKFVL